VSHAVPEWDGLGKALMVTGGLLALAGAVLLLAEKGASGTLGGWLGWFGKLPGDISIKRDGFSFYFPLTTGILISIVLSLLAYFLSKR
jgi:DUF2905 family protein